jgi:hypothetical protein
MLNFEEFKIASSYASRPVQLKIDAVTNLVEKPFSLLNSAVQTILLCFSGSFQKNGHM